MSTIATKIRSAFVLTFIFLGATPLFAATYSVTTTSDSGAGSLRQAILDANANSGLDTIDFSSVTSAAPVTISLSSGLPEITDSVVIDASIPETRVLPDYPTRRPGVVLDMTGIAPTVRVGPFGPVPYYPNGLYLAGPGASDSVIRGLVIITQSQPLGSSVCETDLFNPDSLDPTVPDLALCSRGILLFGVNRVVIAGNYINLDSNGLAPAGSGVSAINLIDSSDNVIGGALPNDRNVVMSSGQTVFGPIDPMITVKLHGWAAQKFGATAAKTASNNSISGNFVGVNAEGLALNAPSSGIVLWSSNAVGFSALGIPGQWGWGAQCGDQLNDPCAMTDNTIENNVVTNGASSLENIGGSRNTTFRDNTVFNTMPFPFQFNWLEVVDLPGLGLPGPAPGKAINMVISGNRLGIDTDGNPSGRNRVGSLQVTNGDNVLIEDNIITGSEVYGIGIREVVDTSSSRNVTITRNSIFGHGLRTDGPFHNPGLGIELAPAPFPGFGVTPNDFQDADTGPNDLQNYPVLAWAKVWKENIRIHGHLNSEPNKSFRIEFFANDMVHPTGHGEGKRYLGAVAVVTNGDGDVVIDTKKFLQTPIGDLVNIGNFVTATATLLCTPDVPEEGDCPFGSSNTSEFSLGVAVTR